MKNLLAVILVFVTLSAGAQVYNVQSGPVVIPSSTAGLMGQTTVTMTSTACTLTTATGCTLTSNIGSANAAYAGTLVVNGSIANSTITGVLRPSGYYQVVNTANAYTLTVQGATGSGCVVSAGSTGVAWSDGVNFYCLGGGGGTGSQYSAAYFSAPNTVGGVTPFNGPAIFSITGPPSAPTGTGGAGTYLGGDFAYHPATALGTSPGQIPVMGATNYAPVTVSGDCTLTSTGAVTCLKTNNVAFGLAATASSTGTGNAMLNNNPTAVVTNAVVTAQSGTLGTGAITNTAAASQSNSAVVANCGDSLTYASDAGGHLGPSTLIEWLKYDGLPNAFSIAAPGKTSTQIATQCGAYNGVQITAGTYIQSLSVSGGTIPASGSVTVTMTNGAYDPTYSATGSSVFPVPITLCTTSVTPTYVAGVKQASSGCAGVTGTLSYASATITLKLDNPGVAVAVPANTPFFVNRRGYEGGFNAILAGANNLFNGSAAVTQYEQDITYYMNSLPVDPTTGLPRGVIFTQWPSNTSLGWNPATCASSPIGLTTGCGTLYTYYQQARAWVEANYPNNYVDLWGLLVSGYDSTSPIDVINNGNGMPAAHFMLPNSSVLTGPVFTASITSSLLTVTAVASGILAALQQPVGSTSTLPTTCTIASQASGTTGGIGTYNLTGCTGTFASQTMTAGAFIDTTSCPNQSTATGSYSTGNGAWLLVDAEWIYYYNTSPSSGLSNTCNRGAAGTTATTHTAGASITSSIGSSLLTVTAVASGYVAVGQVLGSTSTLPTTCYISSQASGTTGGIGTYNLTGCTGTFASQTMTLIGAPDLFVDGLHLGQAGHKLWATNEVSFITGGGDPGPPVAMPVVAGNKAEFASPNKFGAFAPAPVTTNQLYISNYLQNTLVPVNAGGAYMTNVGSGYTSVPAVTCTGGVQVVVQMTGGSVVNPIPFVPGSYSTTPQTCTVAAPPSGTTATLQLTYTVPNFVKTGVQVDQENSTTAAGRYLIGGSTAAFDDFLGNNGQNGLRISAPSGTGGGFDILPDINPVTGLRPAFDVVSLDYGTAINFNNNINGVETLVGKLSVANVATNPYLIFNAAFAADAFINAYNGTTSIININKGENAFTLAGNVTATVSGTSTAYIGTVFTLHVCNTGTQFTLTLPTGFNGVNTISPAPSSCVNQQYLVNGTANFDPVGSNGSVFPTASIGGSSLASGACASTTVTVGNVSINNTFTVSPQTYPGAGFFWNAYYSAANTVTVQVCNGGIVAGATPTASVYNVKVQ